MSSNFACSVAVVAAMVAIAFFLKWNRRRRLEIVLRTLSPRVDGEVRPGRLLRGFPALDFGIRRLPARLAFSSNHRQQPTLHTDLTVGLAGQPRFPVRLGPEGLLAKAGKWLGAQDFELGDPEFDRLFSVQSPDEARLRAFLSPRVREALLELRLLEGGAEVWVGLEQAELRVRKLGWMEDAYRAGRHLELCTQVVEGYLDAVAGAAPAPLEPAGEGRCPVCRDLLGERETGCPSCGARHHPECFELNDGCGRCGAKAAG